MNQPSVILCEKGPRWASLLVRQLPPGVRLREVRSLAETRESLAASPRSLLALEVTRSNLAAVLKLIAEAGRQFPLATAVALANEDLQEFQWALREAGAALVASSPRRLDGLATLASRHFERIDPPSVGLQERIWNSLPWGDFASA